MLSIFIDKSVSIIAIIENGGNRAIIIIYTEGAPLAAPYFQGVGDLNLSQISDLRLKSTIP